MNPLHIMEMYLCNMQVAGDECEGMCFLTQKQMSGAVLGDGGATIAVGCVNIVHVVVKMHSIAHLFCSSSLQKIQVDAIFSMYALFTLRRQDMPAP